MARKLKPGVEAAPSNVTDDVYREELEKIIDKDEAHQEAVRAAQEANGELRAALKAAKKRGCNTTAIRMALAERRKDQDQRRVDLRDTFRVLRLLGAPLGTQFGLFEDGDEQPGPAAGAAGDGDEGAPLPNDAEGANALGQKAALEGRGMDACPYPDTSTMRTYWLQGWRGGSRQAAAIAKRQGGNGAAAQPSA